MAFFSGSIRPENLRLEDKLYKKRRKYLTWFTEFLTVLRGPIVLPGGNGRTDEEGGRIENNPHI